MIGMGRHEALGGCHHGGDRGFHVRDPSSVQVAVAFHGHERIAAPPIDRSGRDDVDVACQADNRRGDPVPCPEVADGAAIEALAAESRDGEARPNEVEATGIVRRDRTAGDQPSGKVEWGVHVRSGCASGHGVDQVRSSSLIEVFARVAASTRFTMTAHAREWVPSLAGRLPGTTTDPDGTRP